MLHFIVSSTSGHAACTIARTCVRIGFANSGDLSMYASMRGSVVAMRDVLRDCTLMDELRRQRKSHCLNCVASKPGTPMTLRTISLALALLAPFTVAAQSELTPPQTEARAIFKQLIEINSSYKDGSTTPAARAMAKRFLDAGFPAADVHVLGPAGDNDSNVVVRMPGTSKTLKPVLLIAHLDVVEALRSDWSVDPYILTERDGFFYGRGTSDIKDGDAILVETLLKLKREHFVPERTIIVALTAGEEGGGGLQWHQLAHRKSSRSHRRGVLHQSRWRRSADQERKAHRATRSGEREALSVILSHRHEQGWAQLDAHAGQRDRTPRGGDRACVALPIPRASH